MRGDIVEEVLRVMLFCSTCATHRIRNGIRHTAARAGRHPLPPVANGCLRHRLIGSARVSTADGSQSLAVPCDALQAPAPRDLSSPSGFPASPPMPLYMEWDKRRSIAYPSILRGARTVMSEHDAFDRVLAAMHDATLDESRWPATSALIDEACGLTGNGLMVAEGPTNDVRALFVGLYARGQRRDDLEREYLTTYHPLDERVPRFRQLPARCLVHITDLYTAEELKTSRTYNELLPRAGMQDSLNVQLPGLAGSHIGWGLNDPVDAEGWGAARITMIERLLPHIQQFVRVRQVLAGAGALGASLADLLATTGLGIIQLDGRGRIAAANTLTLNGEESAYGTAALVLPVE